MDEIRAMAEAVGFARVHAFDDARAYADAFPELLRAPGPTLVHVSVEPGEQGPIGRGPQEAAPYLKVSLADSARVVRTVLTAGGR